MNEPKTHSDAFLQALRKYLSLDLPSEKEPLATLCFGLLFGMIQLVDAILVTNSPPFNNPDHLVQNVLLGPGVPFLPGFPPASNSVQIGKFTNGNSFGFGIDSGIVMISGNAL